MDTENRPPYLRAEPGQACPAGYVPIWFPGNATVPAGTIWVRKDLELAAVERWTTIVRERHRGGDDER